MSTKDKLSIGLLSSAVSSELPTTATVVHKNMCCGEEPEQPKEEPTIDKDDEEEKEKVKSSGNPSTFSLSGGGGNKSAKADPEEPR
eukprot:CAMPEP_0116890570 /NCGR_PEP_ID=MMETSP0467-20121206/1091_1 /TAXON_ID=283647 /ORGANISM="Mesodinium pulex, Strain SPMC105" /LENGTH=85 /DNA_ID=CAMNT_0004558427 /DNA_START=217 /DNA_END=474 /DNA_ORIENTATION=+